MVRHANEHPYEGQLVFIDLGFGTHILCTWDPRHGFHRYHWIPMEDGADRIHLVRYDPKTILGWLPASD